MTIRKTIFVLTALASGYLPAAVAMAEIRAQRH